MSYRSRPSIRERHLLYGAGNAGKSTALLTIARRYSAGTIHIADSDDAWEFMLYDDEEPNKELLKRDNFVLHTVDNEKWDDAGGHFHTIRRIEEAVKPGDIVIYDKISPSWPAVQDWFDHNVFGVGHADYYMRIRQELEAKRESQKGGKQDRTAPLYDSFRDWGPINAQYHLLYGSLYRIASRAHVFLVADAGSIGDSDAEEVKRACLPFGSKPVGQKNMFGFPHTVTFFTHDVRKEEHRVSQVKDRAQRLKKKLRLDDEEWSDYCDTYLTPIARWGDADGGEPVKVKKLKKDKKPKPERVDQ